MTETLKYLDVNMLKITNAFMYTEYPHKSFWPLTQSDIGYRQALQELLASQPKIPLLLYVHIPFCSKLCWFCTCHMIITNDYEKILEYLEVLYAEIDLLCKFFKENHLSPYFTEVHLGGGSPSFLRKEDFKQLVKRLQKLGINTGQLDEFSIEIDPRHTTKEMLRFYHEKGINRVSIGVQDFDPEVQKAINRVQPAQLTKNLMASEIKALFPNGFSFDIICGLPFQTNETIKRTMEECIRLSPDRICLNYLHLALEFAKHQNLMFDGKQGRPDRLPDYYERKQLFITALETLTAAGYIRTGYDHFAKPTDTIAIAMKEGKMRWNALGVTTGRYADIIGIGIHSYSTIGNHYFQNFYNIPEYEEKLKQNQFPIFRGYRLIKDDLIRRDVIQTLRSFFSIDFESIEQKHKIDFKQYFRKELIELSSFIADNFVEIKDRAIIITERGHQFANTVCYVFDAYKESRPRF